MMPDVLWLSRDPIGENGGLNLYGYVGNSPINRTDPTGLWFALNPVTWFDGNGYEGASGRWDAYSAVTANAFEQDAYAGLDGLIPGADPFSDLGYYDPCDEGSQWSNYFGTVSQEALWTAAGLKLAKFRGFEHGRWKDGGVWQEGTHFHLDWGKGLGKHHLPQQAGRFARNLIGVLGRIFK